MKESNKDIQQINFLNNIEASKNKYFFIGFLIAIIPFIIVSSIINLFKNGNLNTFTNVFFVLSVIISLINGFYLRILFIKKANNIRIK